MACRWRSWQVAAPGMFVQLDFGSSQVIDTVTLESADEGYQTKVKLEGRDAQGQWTTLSQQPVETEHPTQVNLRQGAAAELKARGIRYFIVEKTDFRSDDFQMYSALWGIKCIGTWNSSAYLYHIE